MKTNDWITISHDWLCVLFTFLSKALPVRNMRFAVWAPAHYATHTHTLHPHLSWHYSFKLNSETPFSMLLFVLPLPPLPCQHHVRPVRSMWQAAGIMLTFSAPCSSASLSQTPQSTVNHLGQQRSEPDITPWKTKVLHGTKTPLWAGKVLSGSSSWCCTIQHSHIKRFSIRVSHIKFWIMFLQSLLLQIMKQC